MFEELNTEQMKAVQTIEGPVRIIAGAGTGKTKTLVSRVANMMQKGISSDNIMLLTFTNKAAGEMKLRVQKYIGSEKTKNFTACTFHSFCNRFLKRYADLAGFTSSFTILDSGDCLDIISELSGEMKGKLKKNLFDVKSFPKDREILAVNGSAINDVRPLWNTICSADCVNGFTNEVYEILQRYAEYKGKYNMMDYDDLLYFTVRILKENENIRKRLDEKYQYIMVDEYQDTNIIQDEFLKLITRDYRNIAVVGDDNQSIYRFRGAHIENILDFKERYPDCKDIVLVQNYRSTQEILDLSNRVMDHAEEGIQKELVGQKHGKRPDFIIAGNQGEEARKIISYIDGYHKKGVRYKDMAVIIRYGRSSYILEAELNKQRISYKKFGGIKFVEKEHIRNILSYLRAGTSDKDMIAWTRILKLIAGIGPKAAKDIALDVAENGVQALNGMLYMGKPYYNALYILYDIFAEIRFMPPKKQIKYLMENYYYGLMENGISSSRKKDRDKIDALEKLEKSKEDMSLLMEMAEVYISTDEFLEDIVLNAADPEKETDSVNITTIHSAKGLEYDVVFLMDPIQGLFPRTYDGSEPDNREDLRCLYVAITRAKERLHIFLSEFYTGNQGSRELSMHLDHPDVLAVCDYPKELGYFSDHVKTPRKNCFL